MLASAWMLPSALASSRPTAVPSETWPSADDQDHAEQQAAERRQHPLAADRLDDRVGGVDADQHQHEEEEHQDRAGVDDDLDDEQERRVEDEVQHRQADHHDRKQQRGMHGLAHEQEAERGGDHDRGEDPEGHSATSCFWLLSGCSSGCFSGSLSGRASGAGAAKVPR